MSNDEKLDFYLRHHAQIEEWARLRDHAVDRLHRALAETIDTYMHEGNLPIRSELHSDGRRNLGERWILQVPPEGPFGEPENGYGPAYVEILWYSDELFRPRRSNSLPVICVTSDPRILGTSELRKAVLRSTSEFALSERFRKSDSKWWIWELSPALPESLDLDEYAEECIGILARAWRELSAPLTACLDEHYQRVGRIPSQPESPTDPVLDDTDG